MAPKQFPPFASDMYILNTVFNTFFLKKAIIIIEVIKTNMSFTVPLLMIKRKIEINPAVPYVIC